MRSKIQKKSSVFWALPLHTTSKKPSVLLALSPHTTSKKPNVFWALPPHTIKLNVFSALPPHTNIHCFSENLMNIFNDATMKHKQSCNMNLPLSKK